MHEPIFSDRASRWRAVSARNPAADGQFVYAVKTTGIYCRPTCPSRRPRPEHVEFFNIGADAEGAGYRACKRCHPESISLQEQHVVAVRRACALIENAPEPPTLQALARAVGLSRFHFHRLFRDIVGVTPKEYAVAHREDRLRKDLQAGAAVSDAIYSAGYGSSSRVYENAAKTLGMTPSKFRGGGEGVAVHFTITESLLGWLIVAATDKGVCTIALGDNPEVLREQLRVRFRRARLIENGDELGKWVQAVIGFIQSPQRGLKLPLDIQGTAFQRRVWKALQDIPLGSTVSYTDIARAIGKPKAVRAVAQACASNKIALAIPCHRVVRADGSLSGYRWGEARKQRILQKEREAVTSARVSAGSE